MDKDFEDTVAAERSSARTEKRGQSPFLEVGTIVHFGENIVSMFKVFKVVFVDSVIFYLFVQFSELIDMVTSSLFSVFDHSPGGHNECPV